MIEFRMDDLYNTEAVVTLPRGEKVIVRTLTDAEIKLRDLQANTVAAAVEANLLDKEGERYKEIVEPLQQMGREELTLIIMAMAEVTVRVTVERETPYTYIPFPDEATDEEKRQTIRDREESEARIRQRRSEITSRRLAEIREKLDEVEDQEEIRRRATNAYIQAEVFNARWEEFTNQTVYLSARNEDGTQAYDIAKVRLHGKKGGVNDRVYQVLLETYGRVDSADPWELEKKP